MRLIVIIIQVMQKLKTYFLTHPYWHQLILFWGELNQMKPVSLQGQGVLLMTYGSE